MERTEQQNRLAKEDGNLNEGRTRQEERRRISIVLNPRCAYETSSARLATPHAHTATSPLGYVLNEHRERLCTPRLLATGKQSTRYRTENNTNRFTVLAN